MSTLSDALGRLQQQAGEQLADADSGSVAQINAALDRSVQAFTWGWNWAIKAMDSSLQPCRRFGGAGTEVAVADKMTGWYGCRISGRTGADFMQGYGQQDWLREKI